MRWLSGLCGGMCMYDDRMFAFLFLPCDACSKNVPPGGGPGRPCTGGPSASFGLLNLRGRARRGIRTFHHRARTRHRTVPTTIACIATLVSHGPWVVRSSRKTLWVVSSSRKQMKVVDVTPGRSQQRHGHAVSFCQSLSTNEPNTPFRTQTACTCPKATGLGT